MMASSDRVPIDEKTGSQLPVKTIWLNGKAFGNIIKSKL